MSGRRICQNSGSLSYHLAWSIISSVPDPCPAVSISDMYHPSFSREGLLYTPYTLKFDFSFVHIFILDRDNYHHRRYRSIFPHFFTHIGGFMKI